jgi:hypothetical protein
MSPSNKTLEISIEVKKILDKYGRNGWLRVGECEKRFLKLTPFPQNTSKSERDRALGTRHTNFYRWRKKVEDGDIEEFQYVSLGKNISFIGLKNADPITLKTLTPKSTSGFEIGLYLLKHLWMELAEVERENVDGDSLKAYQKAKFLKSHVSKKFRQKLDSAFSEVETQLIIITRKRGYTQLEDSTFMKVKKQAEYLRYIGIPLIVEAVSNLLHEMEKEGVES